jgi:broad specificity phosphatase PhoE
MHHRIILVRHGECYMNLELKDKVGGRSNESPLTPQGEQQASELGRFLLKTLSKMEISKARFYSSTAVRASDTARIMMEHLGRSFEDCVHSEHLLELDMGSFEGQPRSEIYTPEQLEIIRQDVINFRPPGGESQKDVEERMIAYLLDHIVGSNPEVPTLNFVISHGLAIKCVLRHILDSTPHMTRKIITHNTSMTEIVYTPEHLTSNRDLAGWQLLRVNDCSHMNNGSSQ